MITESEISGQPMIGGRTDAIGWTTDVIDGRTDVIGGRIGVIGRTTNVISRSTSLINGTVDWFYIKRVSDVLLSCSVTQ